VIEYLDEIKKCSYIDDLLEVMDHREFPNANNSSFSDPYIYLESKTGEPMKRKFTLQKKLGDVSLRLMMFMKLSGDLNGTPIGSGKANYFNQLQLMLRMIFNTQENILILGDIESTTIDAIIMKYRENTKNKSLRPMVTKLKKLEEWILYGNENLPYFLRLDPSLLYQSKEFMRLITDYSKERRKEITDGSPRAPYDLPSIKKMATQAIKYVEPYFHDIEVISEEYVKLRGREHNYKYRTMFYFFKHTSYKFQEPILSQIQSECQEAEKHTNARGNRSTPKIIQRMKEAIGIYEGACVFIIILLTAMRSQELIRLERFPTIYHGEFLSFKKLIYKTAPDESGEEVAIPIPMVVKVAIENLSKLSQISDGSMTGNLIINDIKYVNKKHIDSRINSMIANFSNHCNVINAPTAHDLRHTMAFLVSTMHENSSLKLVQILLGHKNTKMTLEYLGHYSLFFKDALKELNKKESSHFVQTIVNDLEDGKKLFGPMGERIMGNHTFIGSYADSITDLLSRSLLALIEKGQLAIIQTPVCFCIHDLTKNEAMSCQRGFNIENFINEGPKPSRCEGSSCANALFTESHLEKMVYEDISNSDEISDEIKERLMQNTYFADSGGFDTLKNPNMKLIQSYQNQKKEISNG